MRVALFNDTRSDRDHFGCDIVMRNLEALLSGAGIQATWRWPVGKDWRESLELLPKKGDIDAVIVNGEGSIHHSDDNCRADILADVSLYAGEVLNVPSFLVNATLFGNSNRIYEKLSKFNRCYVRDSMSMKELNANGIDGVVVPDLTLASAVAKINQAQRIGYGSTDSVIESVSHKLRVFSKVNKIEYQSLVTPKKLIFNSTDVNKPNRIFINLKKYLKNILCERRSLKTSDSFIAWIQSKKLIITGRYHAVTLCLLTRTPFIAVESNTPKISALLYDVFGTNKRVFSNVDDISLYEIDKYSFYDDLEISMIEEFNNRAITSAVHMSANIREEIDRKYKHV